jgi:hypothetical protein
VPRNRNWNEMAHINTVWTISRGTTRGTWLVGLSLLLAGCGSERSPIGPSPIPSPATFTGSVTDTVTGAPISGFTALVAGSRLTVSAPGYVTRETRASTTSVDIIPEAGFDLGFYRELARNAHEAPGSLDALRVLAQAPSLYLQRAGLSDAHVAALEQAARAIVPALTGGRFQLLAFESGDGLRGEAAGWIIAELVTDQAGPCGRSAVGASAGHIWLNTIERCRRDGMIIGSTRLLQHELGHSLGFSHVGNPGALMYATTSGVVTDAERHHAAIAYKRTAGNRDVDVDF